MKSTANTLVLLLNLSLTAAMLFGCSKKDEATADEPKATEAGNPEPEVDKGGTKCGGEEPATSTDPDAEKQTFKVKLQFQSPVGDLAQKFLVASVGGDLKEPTAVSKDCAIPKTTDFLAVFDLTVDPTKVKGTSGASSYEILSTAEGGDVAEIEIVTEVAVPKGFYDSLQEIRLDASVQRQEPSAAAGEFNRYVDALGFVTLDDPAGKAVETTIEIAPESSNSGNGDEKQ